MSDVLHSVAHEVQLEIDYVLQEYPNAIDIMGGVDVVEDTVAGIFELDMAFENRDELLFHRGDDSIKTAEEFTRLHIRDYRENGRPSLVTMAMEFADDIGLDTQSPEYMAMILMALRVEKPNDDLPEYHNKDHYADITSVTGEIVKFHNMLAKDGVDGAVAYTPQEQALAFTAALGHDLDHPGGKNPEGEPLKFEMISFEKMKPFLNEAGLDEESIHKIELIIAVTSPDGPHGIIKEVARAHREGDAVDWEAVDADNKFPQLRVLEGDCQLTQLAASLSDADLYPSGAAGLGTNALMSEQFTQEERRAMCTDVDYRTDTGRMGFFNHVIGEKGYTSIAGRAMCNGKHMEMRAGTSNRIAWACSDMSEKDLLEAAELISGGIAGDFSDVSSFVQLVVKSETPEEIDEPEKVCVLNLE